MIQGWRPARADCGCADTQAKTAGFYRPPVATANTTFSHIVAIQIRLTIRQANYSVHLIGGHFGMSKSSAVAFGLAMTLAAAGICAAQEAPSFQINAQHSGKTAFKPGLKLPLAQSWTRNLGGETTYPLIANGMVFVDAANADGSYGSVFYGLNATTGATIWSVAISGTYFDALAAYDNGTIFVINYDGVLQALNATTGAQIWQEQLPNQYAFDAPPTALDGVVYINGAGVGATVYAINEANGSILWQTNTNGSDWGAPSVGKNDVYVSYPCQDYRLKRTTGAVKWNYNGGCDGGGGSPTALYGDQLYTSDLSVSGDVVGAVQSIRTGAIIYSTISLADSYAYERGVGFSYPPAFLKQLGFFVTNNGLFALRRDTGAQAWSFTGDGQISPAAIVVNDDVIAASEAGHLYVLDGVSGRLLQTITLPAGSAQGYGGVPNGLAAGEGIIVVPYYQTLTAYVGASVATRGIAAR